MALHSSTTMRDSDGVAKSSDTEAKACCNQALVDWHCQVTLRQLHDSVEVFGHEYITNISPRTPGAEALLQGDMQAWALEPGLLLYRTQVVDQCDIRSSNVLHASLKLVLLLSGQMRVCYGGQWFDMDARTAPQALLVNLARDDCFMRQWQTGRAERKLVISCSPDWLRTKGLLQTLPFLAQHLRWQRPPLGKRAVALAEQLHHEAQAGAQAHALQRLAWLGKVQALLHEALAQMAEDPAMPDALADAPAAQAPPRDVSLAAFRRLVRLREWMQSTAAEGLSIAAIAQHAGMSVSYLHRHFPQVAQGQSVATFLRHVRLQRARMALEQGGASVAQAAECAGYSSSTHFAKAFRQAYGCAPSQWKGGV